MYIFCTTLIHLFYKPIIESLESFIGVTNSIINLKNIYIYIYIYKSHTRNKKKIIYLLSNETMNSLSAVSWLLCATLIFFCVETI
jgi:hypothetical protein